MNHTNTVTADHDFNTSNITLYEYFYYLVGKDSLLLNTSFSIPEPFFIESLYFDLNIKVYKINNQGQELLTLESNGKRIIVLEDSSKKLVDFIFFLELYRQPKETEKIISWLNIELLKINNLLKLIEERLSNVVKLELSKYLR